MYPYTHSLKRDLSFYGFEPVNLVTGVVIYEGIDFCISGIIPLEWKRIWYSDSSYIGMLGHGVHTLFDSHLITFEQENCIGLTLEDGRVCGFEFLYNDEEYYNREERLTLRRSNEEFRLFDHNKKLYYIYKSVFGAKNNYFHLVKIENEDGLSIKLDIINNRLQKITDVCGRTITVITTPEGFIERLSLELPDGKREDLVIYGYDEQGNMTSVTDALWQTTHIRYTGHLMSEKTDRNGHTFYWEYDRQNRCVHTWGDGGWQEGHINYFPEKGYNTVTDANNATTTYRYLPNQLVTEEEDPLGNITRYDYTDFMELYRQTDPEGRITGYSYDERGNCTAVTYPDNTQEIFIYDGQDRLSIAIDPSGEKNVYVYEEEHPQRLKSIVEKDGTSTHFEYTPQGLIAQIHKDDNRIELDYDSLYNLKEWKENGQTVKEWSCDYRGRVTSEHTPGQMSHSYRYDALDRVRRIYEPDGNRIELKYNAYDDVVEAKDKHRRVTFEYTPLGSLSVREENGTRVQFFYDRMEHLTSVCNQAGEYYRFERDRRGDIVGEL